MLRVCELFGETIRNVFGCVCYFVILLLNVMDGCVPYVLFVFLYVGSYLLI